MTRIRLFPIFRIQRRRLLSLSLPIVDDHFSGKGVLRIDSVLLESGTLALGLAMRREVGLARHKVETGAVDSFRPLNGEVLVDHEDVVDLGLGISYDQRSREKTYSFRAVCGDKVAVPDDQPLRLSVGNPAGRGETWLIGSARSIAAWDLEIAGLALEAAARSECEGERGELEEFTETIGFGSEDLDISVDSSAAIVIGYPERRGDESRRRIRDDK